MERSHGVSFHESAVRVVLLRAAREALERETESRRDETGGMLLGRWTAGGGTLVVTDCTGPGPKAVHRACHFSADAEYQQRALDEAVRLYGTGYVGEWHLHPGKLDHPSDWDLQQSRALLTDRERNLRRMVVLIVNLDPPDGLRIFPYMAWVEEGTTQVESLPWDEVALRLGGHERAAEGLDSRRFQAAGPVSVSEASEEGPHPDGAGVGRRIVRKVAAVLVRLGSRLAGAESSPTTCRDRGLPVASHPGSPTCGREQATRAAVVVCAAGDGSSVKDLPWYRSDAGRRRLGDEKSRLDRAGLPYQAILMAGGNIGFCFAERGGGELVVVCRDGFPRVEPRVIRRRGRDRERWSWAELRGAEPWTEERHVVDLVQDAVRAGTGADTAAARGGAHERQ